MAQRDTLPIPPPRQRSQNADLELQQRLEQQREEEAVRTAQIQNQAEQQKKLAQKTPEEEEEETVQEGMAGVRAHSQKAITNGRLALAFTNVGVNLTTNLLSLVTIVGPIIGILCFIIAAFFSLKTSWEINKIKKLHKNIPPARVVREVRKQILSAKNVIFTSCIGCASTAVAGILVMFLAMIPVVIIYKMIGSVSSIPKTVIKPLKDIVDTAAKIEAAEKAAAEKKEKEKTQ